MKRRPSTGQGASESVILPPPVSPPGWYPDPVRKHEFRYWSGAAWTEHVSDQGRMAIDPIPVRSLVDANTEVEWAQRNLWLGWPPPQNAVRGESHYQDAFRELVGQIREGRQHQDPVEVQLLREPDNPYDRLACMATVKDRLLGYLARDIVTKLTPVVDAAGVESWTVAGIIVGGCVDAPTFGLHLWLDRRLSPGPQWPPSGPGR